MANFSEMKCKLTQGQGAIRGSVLSKCFNKSKVIDVRKFERFLRRKSLLIFCYQKSLQYHIAFSLDLNRNEFWWLAFPVWLCCLRSIPKICAQIFDNFEDISGKFWVKMYIIFGRNSFRILKHFWADFNSLLNHFLF